MNVIDLSGRSAHESAAIGSVNDSILIVDDEPANVLLLERLLEQAGYTNVTSTTNPGEVESLYAESEPDLVMVDLHMPAMDGFEVIRRLRALSGRGQYLPILMLTADASAETKKKALASGAKDFLTKPFESFEVLARVNNLLETRRLHVALRRQNETLEQTVRERTAYLWEAVGELERARVDLNLAHAETIHRLSLAAEFRDDETSFHIQRMSHYCSVLARQAGWSAEAAEDLRVAANLHDIGKIGVPDSILLKPDRLSAEEFDVIKGHPEIGYKILEGSTGDIARTGAVIALTHHERVDGRGYPRGLRGDQIPVEGRIAAIADVFDALTTDRVYRVAKDLATAVEIMREGRGSHFDSDLLDLFMDSLHLVLAQKQRFEDRIA